MVEAGHVSGGSAADRGLVASRSVKEGREVQGDEHRSSSRSREAVTEVMRLVHRSCGGLER